MSSEDEGIKFGTDIEDDGICLIFNERTRGAFGEAGHGRGVDEAGHGQNLANQRRKAKELDRRVRLLLIDEVTRVDRRRIATSIGYAPGRVERATGDVNAFIAMLYQDNYTVYRIEDLVKRLEECMMFSLVSKIRGLIQKYT